MSIAISIETLHALQEVIPTPCCASCRGRIELYVLRDVAAGEEITAAYGEPTTKDGRGENAAPLVALAASDIRREPQARKSSRARRASSRKAADRGRPLVAGSGYSRASAARRSLVDLVPSSRGHHSKRVVPGCDC